MQFRGRDKANFGDRPSVTTSTCDVSISELSFRRKAALIRTGFRQELTCQFRTSFPGLCPVEVTSVIGQGSLTQYETTLECVRTLPSWGHISRASAKCHSSQDQRGMEQLLCPAHSVSSSTEELLRQMRATLHSMKKRNLQGDMSEHELVLHPAE